MTAPPRNNRRFLLVWAILVGMLLVGWFSRGFVSEEKWLAVVALLYFGPFKAAAVIALTADERAKLTRGRLFAYFLWLGAQPRAFLPGYKPGPSASAPTLWGCLLNIATGVAITWGLPHLLPEDTPLLVRAWIGLIGLSLIRFFGVFDAFGLLFRRLGFPVEKAWDNPLIATSLRDFWGRRWNRIMSGLMRETIFTPLARKLGVGGASFAVFVYSGVLHEFLTLWAGGGYGGPTVYFLIQGLGFMLEGTGGMQRLLGKSRVAGWCWTAIVVIGPIGLLAPPWLVYEVIVPHLARANVPGLG